MTTHQVVVRKGPVKIVMLDAQAALSNRMRMRSGGKNFRPVWQVIVRHEATETAPARTEVFKCYDFRTVTLTPKHNPLGMRRMFPWATREMNNAPPGWFETNSEMLVTVDVPVAAPAPAETPAAPVAPESNSTEETSTNG